MRVLLLVVLSACGRVGFDGAADAGSAYPAPTARYLMNDDPTDGVRDATGNGHDGTCTNCPVLVEAVDASGYQFAGNTGTPTLITVPFDAAFDTSTGVTFAFWAKPSTVGGCPVGKLFGTGTANSWQVCASVPTNGQLTTCAGDPCAFADNQVVANAWRRVVVIHDNVHSRTIVNGHPVIDIPTTRMIEDGSPITIGGDIDNGAVVLPWDGVIDDVIIWNHPLSDEELALVLAP
ncbi:MAG TPA: LamG domain-containing protein [Kofleriaceae bacterium]|jgi:hypothetical protein